MQVDQYIKITDNYGVVLGRIIEVFNEDIISIIPVAEFVQNKKTGTIAAYLNFDLTECRNISLYNNEEELIEQNFEYFV